MTVETIDTTMDASNKLPIYCYCNGPEGEMVGCDNPNCASKWFHIKCLKLESLPRTKYWYCPDCRKHSECQRKRKKMNK